MTKQKPNRNLTHPYIPREIESQIDKWLNTKHALVILGPRQVGKTTLLKRYAKKLNARYLSLDDPEIRDTFVKDIKMFSQLYIPANKKIMLDEIQYAPEAGRHLKYLIDIENVKIMTAGSVSDDVRIKLSQYLVGRARFFTLFPFSFKEFLRAVKPEAATVYSRYKLDLKTLSNAQELEKLVKEKSQNTVVIRGNFVDAFEIFPLSQSLLNQLTYNYLPYGGYPEVVLTQQKEEKLEALKHIIDLVLTKDVISYFGFNNTDQVIDLLKYASGSLTSLFTFSEVANYLDIDVNKVKAILDILTRLYILGICRAFSKNKIAEVKKAIRIYFIDTGVANYFSSMPNLVGGIEENYIYSVLYRLLGEPPRYWRTKNKAEVDFVYYTPEKELVAIEVKSGARTTLGKARYSFIRKYSPKYMILLNKTYISFQQHQNTKIIFWPYWLV